ncbi:MAG: 50S ribosomal protein L11 methyltransferase [Bacteroidales bacterium]
MSYIELAINVNPPGEETNNILIAQLSGLGFEGFMEDTDGFRAYIKVSYFSANVDDVLSSVIIPDGVTISYKVTEIEEKNWNEVWESNFEPIIVDNRCLVRASFHANNPKADYDIVIDPRMAFGTGHHQTTYLMLNTLLDLDVEGKAVLDMGCGTGVLSILAEKRHAMKVLAIDNDEWAYRNAKENVAGNGCSRIEVMLGDANLLAGKHFDVVLANINLNTLLNDLPIYAAALNADSMLLMSGMLKLDVQKLVDTGKNLGLKHAVTRYRDDWALVSFTK